MIWFRTDFQFNINCRFNKKKRVTIFRLRHSFQCTVYQTICSYLYQHNCNMKQNQQLGQLILMKVTVWEIEKKAVKSEHAAFLYKKLTAIIGKHFTIFSLDMRIKKSVCTLLTTTTVLWVRRKVFCCNTMSQTAKNTISAWTLAPEKPIIIHNAVWAQVFWNQTGDRPVIFFNFLCSELGESFVHCFIPAFVRTGVWCPTPLPFVLGWWCKKYFSTSLSSCKANY